MPLFDKISSLTYSNANLAQFSTISQSVLTVLVQQMYFLYFDDCAVRYAEDLECCQFLDAA